MKVLFIIPNLGFGGAERVISILSNQLSSRGINVNILITSEKPLIAYPLNTNITVHTIDLKRSKGLIATLITIHSIRQKIKIINPDVIIPFLTDLILLTVLAKINLNKTLIASERNDPNNVFSSGKYRIFKLLKKILYPFVDGFVFQSSQALQNYPNYKEKSKIILNPLEVDKIPLIDYDERDKIIVSVGRLTKQKNHSMLIDSFYKINQEYSDYKLVIFGEGELKKELAEQVNALNLTSFVFFPGNSTSIFSDIRRASIFVLSSDFEGLPNSLVEAMAMGIPCISTDYSPGGVSEIIKNGSNGIIVPIKDSYSLYIAIKSLIEDQQKAKEIGLEATNIRQMVNASTICDEWITYIESKMNG